MSWFLSKWKSSLVILKYSWLECGFGKVVIISYNYKISLSFTIYVSKDYRWNSSLFSSFLSPLGWMQGIILQRFTRIGWLPCWKASPWRHQPETGSQYEILNILNEVMLENCTAFNTKKIFSAVRMSRSRNHCCKNSWKWNKQLESKQLIMPF